MFQDQQAPTDIADADGVPTVRTDAINKRGNTTLSDFDLVNTGHSPMLDNQKSVFAPLVTPKGHPKTYLRGNCIACRNQHYVRLIRPIIPESTI
jgi:hypothetical protein